jgi:Ca2+-binding RTX toxin-like protein
VTTGPGAAADTLVGTAGADSLSGGDGGDSLDGGGGNDSVNGGAGADKITGGSGRDTLSGGDGADFIEIKRSTGPDDVDGGAGSDLLSADFGKTAAGMVIDVSNPGVVQRLPDGTTIVNIEQLSVTAGSGGDLLVGGSLADAMTGLAGNDTLNGGGGADTLNGGDGADVLIGGVGDDSLTGAAGADRFAPGVSGWGVDRIMSFEHGIDLIDLRGFGLSYGDLVITQSGSTVTIDAGALGSFLLLNNVGATTSGDFLFV